MKYILTIFLLISVAYGQTSFSFTSLPFSSTDLNNPNRGAEHWMQGDAAFDNNSAVKLPSTTDTRTLNYYKRINWAQIENAGSGTTPGSPRYTWTTFDADIHNAIDNGQMFSFGILTIAPGYAPYGTVGGASLCYPTYLHNQMQTETQKDLNMDGDWVPNWNSSYYWSAFDSLIYNVRDHINNTSYTPSTGPWAGKSVPYSKVIFYIDVRFYGQSGESNMSGYTATNLGYSYGIDAEIAIGTHPTLATIQHCVNTYKAAFPDTYLVNMSDGFSTSASGSTVFTDQEVNFLLTVTNNKGRFGWRRDNWGADWYDTENLRDNTSTYGGQAASTLIMNAYQYGPIVGEPYNGSYAGTGITPGGGTSPYYDVPREVKLYHANSFGNNNYYTTPSSSTAFRDSIRLASKYCGYRIEPTAGSISKMYANSTAVISMTWLNSGLTKAYSGWSVKYRLKDKTGSIIKTWTSSFNPSNFQPGTTTVNDTVSLSSVAVDTGYSISVKVEDPNGYSYPMQLAITAPAKASDTSYTLASSMTVYSQTVLPIRPIPIGSRHAVGFNMWQSGHDVVVEVPTPRNMEMRILDVAGADLESSTFWASGRTPYTIRRKLMPGIYLAQAMDWFGNYLIKKIIM